MTTRSHGRTRSEDFGKGVSKFGNSKFFIKPSVQAEKELTRRCSVDTCQDDNVDEVYIRVKQREELHLWPLKEDLADWLNTILDTADITADNFMNKLDNGVVVCRLARLIHMRAELIEEENKTKTTIPPFDFKCWPDAKKGSFFARDNTENFLRWCRKLKINEAIMFESDGLVLHSQSKTVLLCLLELGRIASRLGIEAPGLVELEKEIEREEQRLKEEEEQKKRLELLESQDLSPDSREVTPTPEGSSIANSIESHDSGVDEIDELRRSPVKGSLGEIVRSDSGDSGNHDSLERSLQSSPNGSVGDLSSRCSTPSSTGRISSLERKTLISPKLLQPKSGIPVAAATSAKKASPQNFRGLKFERRHSSGSQTKITKLAKETKEQSSAAINEEEVLEESADVLDAKVRHITRRVAEKARQIVETQRNQIDEQRHEVLEREDIPLVKRVSEGRYCIGGRIYFVRLLKGKHVMIRVGGGWDTLEHFLSRHDTMNVVYMKRNTRSKSFQTATAFYEGNHSLKSNQDDWRGSNWSMSSMSSQARSEADRSLTPKPKGESRPRYRSALSAPLQRTQPFFSEASPSCRSSAICSFDSK